MPYNGSGTFQPLPAPTFPAVADDIIYAARFNAVITDLMTGLTQCVTRDGQSPLAANLPMNGYNLSGAVQNNVAGSALIYGTATLKTGAVTNDFRDNTTLVATLSQGSNGNQAASVDFVNVAVQAMAATIIPNVSQSHEALAILNYIGA